MNSKAHNQILKFFILGFLIVSLIQSSIITVQLNQQSRNYGVIHLEMTFQEFVLKFNKKYLDEKQQFIRRKLFQSHVIYLREKVKTCPSCGISKYADWTQEQKIRLRGAKGLHRKFNFVAQSSAKGASVTQAPTTKGLLTKSVIKLPKTLDWRNHKAVTSIKQQGECGNCWAFATTAFFQSQLIRRGQASNNLDLSEHYFFQCDKQSTGCDGGFIQTAIDVGLKYGIPFQADYPLNLQKNYSDICQASRSMKLSASRRISKITVSDNQIIEMLSLRPLPMEIDATNWEDYAPGPGQKRTFQCSNTQKHPAELNHAVLLVGYTETEWIIKNSYGLDWGVDGYMYVSRDKNKNCGVGISIYTFDFKLPSIILGNSVSTSVPIQNIPQAICKISNCLTCAKGGDKCAECQKRYTLNQSTGQCDVKQIQSDQTEQTYDYLPRVSQYFSNCQDKNCAECELNDQEEQECKWCKKSFAINQSSGLCETSPIEGCNYFESKRKLTICYECHLGYDLDWWNVCTYTGDFNTGNKDDTNTVDIKPDTQDTQEAQIIANTSDDPDDSN